MNSASAAAVAAIAAALSLAALFGVLHNRRHGVLRDTTEALRRNPSQTLLGAPPPPPNRERR